MDPTFLPAHLLSALVRAGKIGCLELLDHYISRTELLDPQINAIVVRDFDRARARARELDNQPDKSGPLFGVPLTVKESFDIAGLPTTRGVPAQRNNIPTVNALPVQRLLNAGAVIFGKTNVPLLLADWQSFNEIYGTTNNPWDLTLSPGGSSGGSAAALAAGLTGLEIGSDIGSSIRNPAHYCGLFGHKPTYGICPTGVPAQSDISVIGPLARSADDLALELAVIAGPDDIDAAGWKLDLPPPRGRSFADLRIGVMLDHPLSEVDVAITSKLEELASFLRKQGARVDMTTRPDFDLSEAHRLYITLLRATTSRNAGDASLTHWKQEADRLPTEDLSYYAMMARGITLSHRDFLIANEQRQIMRRAWSAFFRDWDLFLCPAAATPLSPTTNAASVGNGPSRSTVTASPPPTRCSGPGSPASSCCPRPSRRLASRRPVCLSAFRSSARNTASEPRSVSPACWNPLGRRSRPHLPSARHCEQRSDDAISRGISQGRPRRWTPPSSPPGASPNSPVPARSAASNCSTTTSPASSA